MKRLAALVVAVGSLAAPAFARAAAPPPVQHPNPVTYPLRLDYENPLREPDGNVATLEPLAQGVIVAATDDQAFLAFVNVGDLGGFMPAPVGQLELSSGGRNVLSPGSHETQIPLFQTAAGGKVQSFTFTGGGSGGKTPPPDNGNGAGGLPPPPPTPGNEPPPANQGFGGGGGGSGGGGTTTTTTTGGGTTTTTRRPPPTTTTTTTTTPGGTTATGTTTTTGGGGGSGGGGGGSTSVCTGGSCLAGACGVPGIEVDSAPPGCTMVLSDAAPGDSAQETLTITNTTGAPYQLAFEATGPNNNHLWQDLQMDVYDPSGGAPTPPFPALTSWLNVFNTLTTLNPGQTVQYVVVLYLPTTAGNADMGKTAVIDFHWQAQG